MSRSVKAKSREAPESVHGRMLGLYRDGLKGLPQAQADLICGIVDAAENFTGFEKSESSDLPSLENVALWMAGAKGGESPLRSKVLLHDALAKAKQSLFYLSHSPRAQNNNLAHASLRTPGECEIGVASAEGESFFVSSDKTHWPTRMANLASANRQVNVDEIDVMKVPDEFRELVQRALDVFAGVQELARNAERRAPPDVIDPGVKQILIPDGSGSPDGFIAISPVPALKLGAQIHVRAEAAKATKSSMAFDRSVTCLKLTNNQQNAGMVAKRARLVHSPMPGENKVAYAAAHGRGWKMCKSPERDALERTVKDKLLPAIKTMESLRERAGYSMNLDLETRLTQAIKTCCVLYMGHARLVAKRASEVAVDSTDADLLRAIEARNLTDEQVDTLTAHVLAEVTDAGQRAVKRQNEAAHARSQAPMQLTEEQRHLIESLALKSLHALNPN